MTAKWRSRRGLCLWCTHPKYEHDGRVDPAVKAELPRVKWTTSACSAVLCACRRYEQ